MTGYVIFRSENNIDVGFINVRLQFILFLKDSSETLTNWNNNMKVFTTFSAATTVCICKNFKPRTGFTEYSTF